MATTVDVRARKTLDKLSEHQALAMRLNQTVYGECSRVPELSNE